MPSSNNASSQNTAANQQIQQNTAAAQAAFQQWLASNPFPLTGVKPPAAAPQAGFGNAPGASFGGKTGGAMGAPGGPGMMHPNMGMPALDAGRMQAQSSPQQQLIQLLMAHGQRPGA